MAGKIPRRERRAGADGAHGALLSFWRSRRGGVAIEGALSVSVLVLVIAALTGIVQMIQTSDQFTRAARAAARAVALQAEAPANEAELAKIACDAVRSELRLDPDVACDERWSIHVDAYATPAELLANTARGEDGSPGGENGDMVLVRIDWAWSPRLVGWLVSDANADDDDDDDDARLPLRAAAIGLARNERAEQ